MEGKKQIFWGAFGYYVAACARPVYGLRQSPIARQFTCIGFYVGGRGNCMCLHSLWIRWQVSQGVYNALEFFINKTRRHHARCSSCPSLLSSSLRKEASRNIRLGYRFAFFCVPQTNLSRIQGLFRDSCAWWRDVSVSSVRICLGVAFPTSWFLRQLAACRGASSTVAVSALCSSDRTTHVVLHPPPPKFSRQVTTTQIIFSCPWLLTSTTSKLLGAEGKTPSAL